jgi:hypothetical protein
MGKSTYNAPAADPNIGIAQNKLADLATTQWNMFTKDIYPEMLKQSQSQEARAQAQYDLTSSIAKQQQEYAAKDRARYEAGGIPAMEKLKADADLYSTEAEQERLAQGATADITSAMQQQRQQQAMRQQAYGIDPTSGVSQMASGQTSAGEALMRAQAANQTRQAAKDIGLQKQANVYNMYAGLPAQGNASTGIALGASGQGLAGGQTAIANYGATGGALNSAAGTAMGGWGQVGQIGVGKYNADVNAATAAANASNASAAGLGSALGTGAALWMKASDIRIKQDIQKVGKLNNGVSLYAYKYKPQYQSTWGYGPQIGVMAHEVEHIPGAVSIHADGYKLVNYSKVMNHGI